MCSRLSDSTSSREMIFLSSLIFSRPRVHFNSLVYSRLATFFFRIRRRSAWRRIVVARRTSHVSPDTRRSVKFEWKIRVFASLSVARKFGPRKIYIHVFRRRSVPAMDQLIKPRVTRRIRNVFVSTLLSRLPRCKAYRHTADRITPDAMFYIVNSCFATARRG